MSSTAHTSARTTEKSRLRAHDPVQGRRDMYAKPGRCNSNTGSAVGSSIASWSLAGCLQMQPDRSPPTADAGGTTRRWHSHGAAERSLQTAGRPQTCQLTSSRVRTRMRGGVAGDVEDKSPRPCADVSV